MKAALMILNKRKIDIKSRKAFVANQKGVALLEVTIALALIGIVVVTILLGLSTAFKSNVLAQKQATAISLAQQQADRITYIEYVSDGNYDPIIIDATKYPDYSISLVPTILHNGADIHDGLQQITIKIYHQGNLVYSMNVYKGE